MLDIEANVARCLNGAFASRHKAQLVIVLWIHLITLRTFAFAIG
jgi:hypothetical protein